MCKEFIVYYLLSLETQAKGYQGPKKCSIFMKYHSPSNPSIKLIHFIPIHLVIIEYLKINYPIIFLNNPLEFHSKGYQGPKKC